ncbi:MAG: hypothetical protein IKA84_04515 [Clostridia bacterium]|nr:hypothetical protein [Clostridia bacterium]
MYYSKNNFTNVTVPKNYSGNAFRVIDETEKRSIEKTLDDKEDSSISFPTKAEEKNEEKVTVSAPTPSLLNSLFSNISVEDLLLLGLIFVIHQENPNDSILILLLILLLAK